MGGYEYLPLITFGALQHHQRELDDRVARLAALRLGRGLRPADGHLLGAADGDEDLGRHTARAGYDFRQQRWEITNAAATRAAASSFNGAYTRANNSAAPNDRGAVVGAVPARAADRGDRRGRDAGHTVQPVRDRVARASSARRITACSCRTTGASTTG